MRVLVDTSIWSLALRRQKSSEHKEIGRLQELVEQGNAVLCGIILQEILQGIKQREQFLKLKNHFSAFTVLEPTRQTFEGAAELFSKCRSKGFTVSTVDCLIASIAIDFECSLFTLDDDFGAFEALSPIKLYSSLR